MRLSSNFTIFLDLQDIFFLIGEKGRNDPCRLMSSWAFFVLPVQYNEYQAPEFDFWHNTIRLFAYIAEHA